MAEKWIVRDRYGNEIYLTAERWDHILEYHPELEGCLDHVLDTLKKGRRKQEPTMPHKHRYYRRCDELLPDHNHVVVIVIFSVRQHSDGTPNNFHDGLACQHTWVGKVKEMTNDMNIYKTDITFEDDRVIHFMYDRDSDDLEVVFEKGRANSTIELTDRIILRLDRERKVAHSLILVSFSSLTQSTELGPESFSMDNLDYLPPDLRQIVLEIITTPPVNRFLKVSTFSPAPSQYIPITYVERPAALAAFA